jgi:hypothetical protein
MTGLSLQVPSRRSAQKVAEPSRLCFNGETPLPLSSRAIFTQFSTTRKTWDVGLGTWGVSSFIPAFTHSRIPAFAHYFSRIHAFTHYFSRIRALFFTHSRIPAFTHYFSRIPAFARSRIYFKNSACKPASSVLHY